MGARACRFVPAQRGDGSAAVSPCRASGGQGRVEESERCTPSLGSRISTSSAAERRLIELVRSSLRLQVPQQR
jgi:hypothetical protein